MSIQNKQHSSPLSCNESQKLLLDEPEEGKQSINSKLTGNGNSFNARQSQSPRQQRNSVNFQEPDMQDCHNKTGAFAPNTRSLDRADLISAEGETSTFLSEGKGWPGRDVLLLRCRDAIEQLHVQIEEERLERTKVEVDLKQTFGENCNLKNERAEMVNQLTKLSGEQTLSTEQILNLQQKNKDLNTQLSQTKEQLTTEVSLRQQSDFSIGEQLNQVHKERSLEAAQERAERQSAERQHQERINHMQNKMDESSKARERELREEFENKLKSQKQKYQNDIARCQDTLTRREQEINELEESLNQANSDKIIMSQELQKFERGMNELDQSYQSQMQEIQVERDQTLKLAEDAAKLAGNEISQLQKVLQERESELEQKNSVERDNEEIKVETSSVQIANEEYRKLLAQKNMDLASQRKEADFKNKEINLQLTEANISLEQALKRIAYHESDSKSVQKEFEKSSMRCISLEKQAIESEEQIENLQEAQEKSLKDKQKQINCLDAQNRRLQQACQEMEQEMQTIDEQLKNSEANSSSEIEKRQAKFDEKVQSLQRYLKQVLLRNEQCQELIQEVRKESVRAIGTKLDQLIDRIIELMFNNKEHTEDSDEVKQLLKKLAESVRRNIEQIIKRIDHFLKLHSSTAKNQKLLLKALSKQENAAPIPSSKTSEDYRTCQQQTSVLDEGSITLESDQENNSYNTKGTFNIF